MRTEPAPVVIPAHGRGTRAGEVTSGRPKAMLQIEGRPLLARLLDATSTLTATTTLVYTREGDRSVPDYVASHFGAARVEVRFRSATGYLRDLVEISGEVGDEFTVLDSDLVAPHAELCAYLRDARAPNRDEAFVVAASAEPGSSDPRSIRVVNTPDGRVQLRSGHDAAKPRAIGAYHWRAPAVSAARAFLEMGGTFHGFVEHEPGTSLRIGVVGISAAVNVNTSADLARARELVRFWREEGLEA